MFAAGKLKDLKYCKIPYVNYLAVGIQEQPMRTAFSKAVSAYTHSIDELRIEFWESWPYDEASAPTNLIPFSSPIDPLNLAFHNLIQDAFVSKATLVIEHVISPEFFWPYGNFNAVPTNLPFWPNLKEMRLICSPVTPGGDWYFMGDPNIASHAEFVGQNISPAQSQIAHSSGVSGNVFRSIPNPGKMNPLLIAMARAVRFAPSVREMQLLFDTVMLNPKFIKKTVDMKREFQVFYFASGFNNYYWASPVEKDRLICQVGNWRMDEEVERHWKDALGPDGVIIYI